MIRIGGNIEKIVEQKELMYKKVAFESDLQTANNRKIV